MLIEADEVFEDVQVDHHGIDRWSCLVLLWRYLCDD